MVTRSLLTLSVINPIHARLGFSFMIDNSFSIHMTHQVPRRLRIAGGCTLSALSVSMCDLRIPTNAFGIQPNG